MNDIRHGAIQLTSIGLAAERDYEFHQLSVSVAVYPIVSVNGSSYFVVFTDAGRIIAKKEFDNPGDAAYAFATTVWKLMDRL